MKLSERNAIVTGASHGLGRVIAEQFVREGASVLLCARGEEALDALVRDLHKIVRPGQQVLARRCDVSVPDEVARLFEVVDEEFGALHVLVNNAGIYGPKGLSDEVPWEEWVRAVEINLHGTFLPSRFAIPIFRRAGYGKIVNLSGGGATSPLPRLSAYAASKAAVVRLTETLAEELRPIHVDVNAVAPGALNTRLLDEVLSAGPEIVGQDFYERAIEQSQTGGVPLEQGARLCVYLASGASDGITGKLISAQWDPWPELHQHLQSLEESDIYTLRRIVPKDRGEPWGDPVS